LRASQQRRRRVLLAEAGRAFPQSTAHRRCARQFYSGWLHCRVVKHRVPLRLPVEARVLFFEADCSAKRRCLPDILNLFIAGSFCLLHYYTVASLGRKHDAHHSGRGWGVGNQPYWRGGCFGSSNERTSDQRGCRSGVSHHESCHGRRPPPWEISRV
jgi:hypothetical protein